MAQRSSPAESPIAESPVAEAPIAEAPIPESPVAAEQRHGTRRPPRAQPNAGADRVAFALALWFGCGRVPRAPGTAGSIGALPVYFAVNRAAGADPLARSLALAATGAAIAGIGVWASARVARATGLADPQEVCIDEVAGVLLTWAAAPPTWPGVLAGFTLFRLLDWLKPPPARALERLPGGLGIVLDDVAAAAWSAAALAAARLARVL